MSGFQGVRRLVIDPGHGGASFGDTRFPSGPEKVHCLEVGRRIPRYFGQGVAVALTREQDVELSAGQRAWVAREQGADAFVSVHFGGAGPGAAVGTWVHASASPQSVELARYVQHAVSGALGQPDTAVRSGELAVLHPDWHRPETAACMLEIGSPASGAYGAGGGAVYDALAAAVAQGVGAWMEAQAYGAGHGGSFPVGSLPRPGAGQGPLHPQPAAPFHPPAAAAPAPAPPIPPAVVAANLPANSGAKTAAFIAGQNVSAAIAALPAPGMLGSLGRGIQDFVRQHRPGQGDMPLGFIGQNSGAVTAAAVQTSMATWPVGTRFAVYTWDPAVPTVASGYWCVAVVTPGPTVQYLDTHCVNPQVPLVTGGYLAAPPGPLGPRPFPAALNMFALAFPP